MNTGEYRDVPAIPGLAAEIRPLRADGEEWKDPPMQSGPCARLHACCCSRICETDVN